MIMAGEQGKPCPPAYLYKKRPLQAILSYYSRAIASVYIIWLN